MSVKNYLEERAKFENFKYSIAERENWHCQACGKRSKSFKVFFANENAKENLDGVQALLLCPKCFDVTLSAYKALQAQEREEYAYK